MPHTEKETNTEVSSSNSIPQSMAESEPTLESTEKEDSRPWIHVTLERAVEQACRWIFFWETDEKRLGTLLRFLHHSFSYTMILIYIFIHTVYPSYILLCFFTFVMALVWLQHFLTGGCVVSKIEQRLLKDTSSFVDHILKILHMPITQETSVGLVTYTSSLVLGMSLMELSSRTILTIRTFFS